METVTNDSDNAAPVTSVWRDTGEILRRARLGVREAVRDHALAGNPVAVWRDGKVVMLSPEEVFAQLRKPKPSSHDKGE